MYAVTVVLLCNVGVIVYVLVNTCTITVTMYLWLLDRHGDIHLAVDGWSITKTVQSYVPIISYGRHYGKADALFLLDGLV